MKASATKLKLCLQRGRVRVDVFFLQGLSIIINDKNNSGQPLPPKQSSVNYPSEDLDNR